jgi:glutamyl-tRNA synthetase
MLNIHGDMNTHTSDHFDRLYQLAIKLIKDGNAYTDKTDQAEVLYPHVLSQCC